MSLFSKAGNALFGGGDPAKAEREKASRVSDANYASTVAAIKPYQDYGQSLTQRFGNQGSDALQQYTDYLNQGVTDQQRAAFANQQLGNTDRAFAQGQSDLAAQLAGQGQRSPLDSSVTVGALASLYGQRAGAIGQAGAAADQYARSLQQQNLAQRYNLLSGAANQGASIGYQGAQIQNNAGNAYAGQQQNIAEMAQQAKQAQQQGLIGGISQLASAYGAFKGMQGNKVQAPTPLSPRYQDVTDINEMLPSVSRDAPIASVPMGQATDPYLGGNLSPMPANLSPIPMNSAPRGLSTLSPYGRYGANFGTTMFGFKKQ